MPYVDYFCPMVYPSHYGPYTFGFDGAERPPLRRDQRDAEDHESPRPRGCRCDSAVDPGLRLREFRAVHREPDPRAR